MKHRITFLLLATITLLNSCKKDQTPELIGKWKLVEQLMDPGDGSGVFVAVQSNKTIEFFEDGTITSNGDLCGMGSGSDNASSGTYSEAEQTIESDDCVGNGFWVRYKLEGANVILDYPCFEPCRIKYERLKK